MNIVGVLLMPCDDLYMGHGIAMGASARKAGETYPTVRSAYKEEDGRGLRVAS